MSEDNAIVNEGDAAKLISVELKDHSKDPVITDEKFRELAEQESKIEGIGPLAISPELLLQGKKKRGRPAKKAVVREFYCGTCREKYDDLTVMKMGAGEGRWAIFCPVDQKALGFLQPDLDKKVADLVKNNPTK